MTPDNSTEPTAEPTAPKVRTRKAPAKAPRAPRAPRAAKPAPVSAPVDTPVSQTDFIGAVKEIIVATRPPEKITAGNRVAYNPMNPTNEKREWAKPFYQNFEPVLVDDVTPLEYQLIPQLKAGLFVKSRKGIPLVEVIIVKRGPQRGIHLRYDNSKKDKGIELMTYAPSLEVMLQKCIAEYAVQQKALAARRAAGLPDDEED